MKNKIAPPKNFDEKIDFLRLYRTKTIGPHSFRMLMNLFPNVKKAIQYVEKFKAKNKNIVMFSKKDAESELLQIKKFGAKTIFIGEQNYPKLLEKIDSAPPFLHVMGNDKLLNKMPNLSIVGGRNASIQGRKLSLEYSQYLNDRGVIIVSGLAYGIDAAAHEGALKNGTIAVIANGLDVIYPKENTKLYAQIQEYGCIITEYPMGQKPFARSFPFRNRIIAAISQATLVVEASFKSGSLISANFALDYGKEILVIPGSPADPRTKGSNNLIKNGAVLINEPDDIISVLENSQHLFLYEKNRIKDNQEEILDSNILENPDYKQTIKLIEENLSSTPIALDEIIAMLKIRPEVMQQALLELELMGKIERHSGNKISLII